MIQHLEEFKFQDMNLSRFKKPFSVLLLIVFLICGGILIPRFNTIIVNKAESIQSIARLNMTWSFLITSFAVFGMIVSLTILSGIYLKEVSQKTQIVLYTIFTAFLLVFLSIITYKYAVRWVTSDHSSELVLGKFLAEKNAIMTSDWYYSTELRIIHQNFFLIPLFKLLNNWHTVRALTVLFNNILLLVSYYVMMRQTNINTKWICLTSIFLLVPTNFVYFDIVTFGGYYIFHLSMFFCFIGFYLFMIKNSGKEIKYKSILILLFSGLAFLYGICGVRSIMDFFFPLFITSIFILFHGHKKSHYPIVLSAIGLLFGGIGYIINILLHFVYKYSSDLRVIWDDPFEVIFEKLGNIIWYFPQYIGFQGNSPLFTPNGILNLFSLILVIVISAAVYKIIFQRKANNRSMEFPRLFIPSFFFITVICHLCLYMLISPEYLQLRYFIMVFIFYIPVSAIFFDKFDVFFSVKIKTVCITFTALTVLAIGGTGFYRILIQPDINSGRYGYIHFLEENDLNFGFATFWNANVTSELSNGKITVGGLDEETGLSHDNWMTKKEYENPHYLDKEVFVLYSKKEWDNLKNTDRLRMKKPVYEDNSFVVLTYPSTETLHEQLLF